MPFLARSLEGLSRSFVWFPKGKSSCIRIFGPSLSSDRQLAFVKHSLLYQMAWADAVSGRNSTPKVAKLFQSVFAICCSPSPRFLDEEENNRSKEWKRDEQRLEPSAGSTSGFCQDLFWFCFCWSNPTESPKCADFWGQTSGKAEAQRCIAVLLSSREPFGSFLESRSFSRSYNHCLVLPDGKIPFPTPHSRPWY